MLTNALAIHRVVWTNSPAKLEEGLINLAELRFQARKFAEAEPLHREFLASRLARLAPEDDNLVAARVHLAVLLSEWAWAQRPTADGDDASPAAHAREAVQLLRECVAIRNRTMPAASTRLADVKSRLGGALLTLAVCEPGLNDETRAAQLAQAEPFLLEANEALSRSGPSNRSWQREALERLVRLYDSWEKLSPNNAPAGKAADWRRTLADFNAAAGTGQSPAK